VLDVQLVVLLIFSGNDGCDARLIKMVLFLVAIHGWQFYLLRNHVDNLPVCLYFLLSFTLPSHSPAEAGAAAGLAAIAAGGDGVAPAGAAAGAATTAAGGSAAEAGASAAVATTSTGGRYSRCLKVLILSFSCALPMALSFSLYTHTLLFLTHVGMLSNVVSAL
jgi:hypothetical protein